MEPDDGMEDEGPFSAWLAPDDRLWRHPSEVPVPGTPSSAPELSTGGARGPAAIGVLIRNGQMRTWTVAVIAGVVGALLASGVSMAAGDYGRRTTVLQAVTQVSSPDTVALAAQSSNPQSPFAPVDWAAVYSAVAASVVGIVASDGSIGSGVLYAAVAHHSYIVTTDDLVNGHLVVTFNDGMTEVARVVSTDPKSGLAILSVPGTERSIPSFGTVASLRVAETVLAVGPADQQPEESLSVSSVDATSYSADDGTLIGMVAVTGNAPTDEGGALVDASGDVVGITTSQTATDPDLPNTSYAIPIDQAVHVAQQLLSGRAVTHPYVGVVDSEDLSSASARQFGISGGALVEVVAPGSPASSAGLNRDDVITHLNGATVSSAGSLVSLIGTCKPGAQINVAYLHKGKPATATLRVIEQPGNIEDADG